jgi:hypothetical protein
MKKDNRPELIEYGLAAGILAVLAFPTYMFIVEKVIPFFHNAAIAAHKLFVK